MVDDLEVEHRVQKMYRGWDELTSIFQLIDDLLLLVKMFLLLYYNGMEALRCFMAALIEHQHGRIILLGHLLNVLGIRILYIRHFSLVGFVEGHRLLKLSISLVSPIHEIIRNSLDFQQSIPRVLQATPCFGEFM